MQKIPSLAILALSFCTSSNALFNVDAKLSLYEPSLIPAANLTELDCTFKLQERYKEIAVPIGTCVYGDYFLVNNLKVTQSPSCANGKKPVLLFYASTSCTGKTTFRSDESDVDIVDRCLFGSSPNQWSMIFRCDNLESQAVRKHEFISAALPNKKYPWDQKELRREKLEPTAGVVTTFAGRRCGLNEPTILPSDTCLLLEDEIDGIRSVFVSQSAICANGKAARLYTYADSDCSTGPMAALADNPHSTRLAYKLCQSTDHQSVAFICNDRPMGNYKDLPPHTLNDVQPLLIHDQSSKSIESKPQEFAQYSLRRYWNMVSWNTLDWQTLPSDNLYRPSKPQGGDFKTFHSCDGQAERNIQITKPKAVDTCIDVSYWSALKLTQRPMCGDDGRNNLTLALLATYYSRDCLPETMTSLTDLPRELMYGCADISDIGSLVFWCNGLPLGQQGHDLPEDHAKQLPGNPIQDSPRVQDPQADLRLYKILTLIFGGILGLLITMAAMIALITCLCGKTADEEGDSFWVRYRTRIFKPLGEKEGTIRL